MHLAAILGLAAAAMIVSVTWRRRSSHGNSEILHVFPSASDRDR
jgi:hypothetical protein